MLCDDFLHNLQPKIAAYLDDAIEQDKLSHAYLFVGPAGSGKDEAAQIVAMARVCAQKGCGVCDDCSRVLRKTHPDIHWIDPEGSGYIYIIDQIRQLNSDASLSPIRCSHKVFIITQAQSLTASCANAFLKTLEEPLEDTSFILMAPTQNAVLPTITSRCQVVSFPGAAPKKAASIVCNQAGVDEVRAIQALAIVGGSISDACAFLESPSRQSIEAKTLVALANISTCTSIDLFDFSESILSAVKDSSKDMEETYNRELEEQSDFLSKGLASSLEKQQKRKISIAQRQRLNEILSIARVWLRDCLLKKYDCEDIAVAIAQSQGAGGQAGANNSLQYSLSADGYVEAMAVIDRAATRIGYNVTPQLALDAMLLELREVLYVDRNIG